MDCGESKIHHQVHKKGQEQKKEKADFKFPLEKRLQPAPHPSSYKTLSKGWVSTRGLKCWCGCSLRAKIGERFPGFRASQQESNWCKGRVAGTICHHSTSQCDTTRMGQEVVVGFISTDKGQAGTAKVRVNGASSKSIAARLAQGQRWVQMILHYPVSLCCHLHRAAEHFLEYRALKWFCPSAAHTLPSTM